MHPQYPQQYPPQPQYPAQGYPQPAPAAPVQYPPPASTYPAPAVPQYQPQAYPPPVAPQPIVNGTLDSFYGQPSTGGGKAWSFNGKPVGTSYSGVVARALSNGDVRAQTNNAGQVQTFRDGRPKLVMVVPMLVQQSPDYPEGQATWWVKGQARDELARAMAEAGAPEGPPEAGALITVTLAGQRPVPGMNPQLLYRITYQRGPGATQAQQPAPAVATQQPVPTPPAPVQQAPVPVPPQPVQQPAPAAVAQPAAPGQVQMPAGLGPEQQQLWAQLTGQQVQA